MNSTVYLNGALLGSRPYGYSTFEIDISGQIDASSPNVIAVRVDNGGRNSRYYSGSGIYRHVWLTVLDAVHVPLWGVRVTTPGLVPTGFSTAASALVVTAVQVANSGTTPAEAAVTVRVRSPDGQLSGSGRGSVSIAGGGVTSVQINVSLDAPVALWSTTSPALHAAQVSVVASGGLRDSLEVPFGIRSVSFNASHGFVLNGVPTKMCVSPRMPPWRNSCEYTPLRSALRPAPCARSGVPCGAADPRSVLLCRAGTAAACTMTTDLSGRRPSIEPRSAAWRF